MYGTEEMGKALRGVLGAVLIVALFGGTPVSSAEPDFDTPTGHYYSQTSGMAGYGFTLENSGGVDFWDEFRRPFSGTPSTSSSTS